MDIKDVVMCARPRTLELFVWKAEELPGADLLKPNDVFLQVAESGLRLYGRDAELRALKGRIIGGVGCPPNCRTSGKPRGSSDLLELFRKMLHFGKIPKKFG